MTVTTIYHKAVAVLIVSHDDAPGQCAIIQDVNSQMVHVASVGAFALDHDEARLRRQRLAASLVPGSRQAAEGGLERCPEVRWTDPAFALLRR